MARILMIEDCEASRLFVEFVAEDAGHELITAASFEEFGRLELPPPDLVLLDLHVATDDPGRTLRTLRERFGLGVPVVLYTSALEPERSRAAAELGADGSIAKGLAPASLTRQLEAHLTGGERLQEG